MGSIFEDALNFCSVIKNLGASAIWQAVIEHPFEFVPFL
jgi:hypothetical protein